MSSKRPDCTPCQEWELCPFHPDEPAPRAAVAPSAAKEHGQLIHGEWVPPVVRVPVSAPTVLRGGAPTPAPSVVVPADWRYLGLDDPEVLGPDTPPDLIYAVPGGGVVGVPQTAKARTAAFAIDLAAELRASGQHARATLLESWRRRYV